MTSFSKLLQPLLLPKQIPPERSDKTLDMHNSGEYELSDVKVGVDPEREKRDGSPDSGVANSGYLHSTDTVGQVRGQVSSVIEVV